MTPFLERCRELYSLYRKARRFRSKWFKGAHEVDVRFYNADLEMERFEWCQDNLIGRFCMANLRDPDGQDSVYIGIRYGFTRPEDAFAFKMRWC